MKRIFLFLTLAIGILAGNAEADLKPYAENPMYWEYNGEPVLLIGGSDLDSLFQWDESVQLWLAGSLTDHLDTLQSVGGNYVRNNMNSRSYDLSDDDNPLRYTELPYPFLKVGSDFDLDQWDPVYWQKLEALLSEAQDRDIIVQIEVWDRYIEQGNADDTNSGWHYSPWNPDNNVNYNWGDSPYLLSNTGWYDYNPLHDAGGTSDNVVQPFQQKYVRKIVDTVVDGGYDNVLFQIDNEGGIGGYDLQPDPYWANFIRDYAQSKGRTVYVTASRRFHSITPYLTTNFQDWNNPEIYNVVLNSAFDFNDISQNNGNYGQAQYENLVWYRSKMIEHDMIRPINNVKAYYFNWPTGGSWSDRTNGNDPEASAKMWRGIFAGAASFRFHRNSPTLGTIAQNGIGLSSLGQTNIQSMRMLDNKINIFSMEPNNGLLSQRSNDEAYCLAEPGEQFAVFFTDNNGHSVGLDLSSMSGELELNWLDVANNNWRPPSTITGGSVVTLNAPDSGHWVAVMKSSSQETANPNASPEAKAVLGYLSDLPNRQDNRVLSGQDIGHATSNIPDRNDLVDYDQFVTALNAQTGKYLGLIGIDYGHSNNPTPAEISIANQAVINHWNAGGLVTIGMHPNNPWTGGTSWDTYGDLHDLVTPGTDAYNVWMAQLDIIANGLQELEDNNVVVLWRPFHEMNGGWFWWGDKSDYEEVWQYTFNYLTNTKGLDNLLWVYSPGSSNDCISYYPGDGYVDIVAIDSYTDNIAYSGDTLSCYNDLLTTGKPIAFGELGPVTRDGSYDNMITINGIRSNYPLVTYFLVWHSWTDDEVTYKLAIVDCQNAQGLMDDSWIITRDEVDWGQPSSCGNGGCDPGECNTCSQDCSFLDCCPDGICNNGETCSSCSGDCPTGPGEVCCSGTLYNGNCCDDSYCNLPETCNNHICSEGPGICDDIALLMRFDEDSSTTRDSSGNGNNGIVNGPTFTLAGISSGAFDYDGANDYVQIDDPGTGSALDLPGDFTLSAWVKFDTLIFTDDWENVPTNFPRILQKGTDMNDPQAWGLAIDTYSPTGIFCDAENVLYFTARIGGTRYHSCGTTSLQTGEWYHVAAVRSGTDFYFYLNGTLDATETLGSANDIDSYNEALYIGEDIDNPDGATDGVIDGAAIWNRPLTSDEIQELHQKETLYCIPQDFHQADTIYPFGHISMQELLDFIYLWHQDSTEYPMREMMEAVVLYYSP